MICPEKILPLVDEKDIQVEAGQLVGEKMVLCLLVNKWIKHCKSLGNRICQILLILGYTYEVLTVHFVYLLHPINQSSFHHQLFLGTMKRLCIYWKFALQPLLFIVL